MSFYLLKTTHCGFDSVWINLHMLSVSSLQVVQQPKPLHRGHIWLSPYPMAQHSGGTDLCGHSHQVFQGLSHRGAQWPTANCRLCPSDNPDMSDPRHGQPGGAQDQERRWQRLKVLNFCSTAKKCQPGLPSLETIACLHIRCRSVFISTETLKTEFFFTQPRGILRCQHDTDLKWMSWSVAAQL